MAQVSGTNHVRAVLKGEVVISNNKQLNHLKNKSILKKLLILYHKVIIGRFTDILLYNAPKIKIHPPTNHKDKKKQQYLHYYKLMIS